MEWYLYILLLIFVIAHGIYNATKREDQPVDYTALLIGLLFVLFMIVDRLSKLGSV